MNRKSKPPSLQILIHVEQHLLSALENARAAIGPDLSTNELILILFTEIHRSDTIETYLQVNAPLPLIFAPTSDAPRVKIRIQDPTLMISLKTVAGKLGRPLSVIAYSLLRQALSPYIANESYRIA